MKNEIEKIKNTIIIGDSLKELKKIPDNSINVIFADPPYFMQTEGKLERFDGTEFKGVNDKWDKFNSYKEYDSFTKKWLIECKRILKENGTIWVIGTYHNLFRLGYIMQDLKFWILNDIIWNKTNPTPNFKGTKFVNAQETLIWATKNKNSKFTFNYKTMKKINGGKQMKSVWNFATSIGKERIKDEEGKKLHNTQKPEKLLEYVILSSTKKDDIILDPFFGTGTTGAIAKKYERNYIGIEKEKKYVKYAKERINNQVISENKELINSTLDIKIKKTNIVDLMEMKILVPQYLYNAKREKVFLKENGKILHEGVEYSLHQATKIFEKGKYSNGWVYWYIKQNNKFILIDEFRKEK